MTTFLARFARHEKGGAVLEFAMMGPVLALLLVAITDFGLGFWKRMQVQSAAQRGAIYATVNGYNTSGITSAVTSTGASISAAPAPSSFCGCPSSSGVSVVTCGSSCVVSGSTVDAGRYVKASAQASYATIFHYPGITSPLTFSASQSVRIQ